MYIVFGQVKGQKMMENNAKQRVPFDLKAKSYLWILLGLTQIWRVGICSYIFRKCWINEKPSSHIKTISEAICTVANTKKWHSSVVGGKDWGIQRRFLPLHWGVPNIQCCFHPHINPLYKVNPLMWPDYLDFANTNRHELPNSFSSRSFATIHATLS